MCVSSLTQLLFVSNFKLLIPQKKISESILTGMGFLGYMSPIKRGGSPPPPIPLKKVSNFQHAQKLFY